MTAERPSRGVLSPVAGSYALAIIVPVAGLIAGLVLLNRENRQGWNVIVVSAVAGFAWIYLLTR